MKRDALYHLLDRAFRESLERLQMMEFPTAIVDLYLMPNPEAAEFSVFDDEDHLLVKVPVQVWEDENESEAILAECESMLKEIVHAVKEEGGFEQIRIMKPFSVLMVDDEMEILSELLLLDDEQILLDDDFLKNMDAELDDFFKQLMSDV